MNETMTDRELDAWLAEHLFRTLTHEPGGTWGYSPIGGDYRYAWSDPSVFNIPAYSSTGEGMLMVIEAMRERGDAVEIVCPSALAFQVTVYQSWGNGDRRVRSESPSLPRAVAEAARAALEDEA